MHSLDPEIHVPRAKSTSVSSYSVISRMRIRMSYQFSRFAAEDEAERLQETNTAASRDYRQQTGTSLFIIKLVGVQTKFANSADAAFVVAAKVDPGVLHTKTKEKLVNSFCLAWHVCRRPRVGKFRIVGEEMTPKFLCIFVLL
jgi:hypothetical protein